MDGSWVKYGVVPEDRSLTVAALTYHRRARLHGRERRKIGEWRGLIPVGAGEEVVCAVVGMAVLHGVFQVTLEGDGVVTMEAVADTEIGRFLTEVAHFPRIAPFLGDIRGSRGRAGDSIPPAEQTTLAMLHGLVENEGDGW